MKIAKEMLPRDWAIPGRKLLPKNSSNVSSRSIPALSLIRFQECDLEMSENAVFKLSNLVIAYSLDNFEISGTAEALAALGELLVANKSGSLIIEFIKPQQSAHPYSGFIEKVLIKNEPHKVVVSQITEITNYVNKLDKSLRDKIIYIHP